MSFIFYHYYKLEEEHLSEALYLEMKNYSFNLQDTRFNIDIIPKADKDYYELSFDAQSLYILAPLMESSTDSLKIYYPRSAYHTELKEIQKRLYWQFSILTLISLVIAILFAYYTLRPLRNALYLLEEFIKDIIHDLNTPITSILINLKMMPPNEEVESIQRSAKSIVILHKNLDSFLRETALSTEPIILGEVLQEQIAFFESLYAYLDWDIRLDESIVESDYNALSRICYNLISNACKYNTTTGNITITCEDNTLSISNDSYGIKRPQKVFERFYKEGERGLGIGLHIVDKLCQQLHIQKSLTVVKNRVTVRLRWSNPLG